MSQLGAEQQLSLALCLVLLVSSLAWEFHNQAWTFSCAEQLLWTREVREERRWPRRAVSPPPPQLTVSLL